MQYGRDTATLLLVRHQCVQQQEYDREGVQEGGDMSSDLLEQVRSVCLMVKDSAAKKGHLPTDRKPVGKCPQNLYEN